MAHKTNERRYVQCGLCVTNCPPSDQGQQPVDVQTSPAHDSVTIDQNLCRGRRHTFCCPEGAMTSKEGERQVAVAGRDEGGDACMK
jgi:ferredoxin